MSMLETLYKNSYSKMTEIRELDELIHVHTNRKNEAEAKPLRDARAILAQVYLDDAKLLQKLRAEALEA